MLVSRQFVKMTKLRIEGLLAAFPKLVGSGGQHTFIETENVRYLYQPIEQLYALLITNKQSNIMEDLDTLRLVAKLVRRDVRRHLPCSSCVYVYGCRSPSIVMVRTKRLFRRRHFL